jgi:hypothetical protein
VLLVISVPQLCPPATILPAANDWTGWLSNLQPLFGLITIIIAAFEKVSVNDNVILFALTFG